MPQRDYISRSKKKGGMSKSTMLSIIIVLFLGGVLGLWLLKENAPAPVIPTQTATPPTSAKSSSNLPSRPEEVYSYIRDLESREVITDNSKKAQEKLAQLSKEQLQQLEEKRKQEEAARLAAETPAQPEPTATTTAATETAPAAPQLSAEQLAAQKAQEQKLAEEKRKQAELKKQQELAKKAEQAKQAEAKAATEKAKTEAVKKAEPVANKETATVKTAEKAPAATGRFGLQCGAFKNKAQAENMQARLVMSGFNARIATSGEWNRVFVGPIGDRAAASTAQSNARSVAECLIVTM